MGYLTLRFENACALAMGPKAKHLFRDVERMGDFKYALSQGHDLHEPITWVAVSNVLHCLCGEIPVPSKRMTMFRRDEKLDAIAKEAYIRYEVKPIVNEKGFAQNREFFSTGKLHYDSKMKGLQTLFVLFDGTVKKMIGHYTWDVISRSFSKEDLTMVLDFIRDVIGCDPLRLTLPQTVYELSKHCNEEAFKEKAACFYEETKGLKTGDGKKVFKGWVYNLFLISDECKTSNNLPIVGSATPFLEARGVGYAVPLSGDIICELDEETEGRVRRGRGVANMLEGGIVYVSDYQKYEPIANYKDIFEKIPCLTMPEGAGNQGDAANKL